MESHFVVVYDHKTGNFSIDWETGMSVFPDGNIFDGETWLRYDFEQSYGQKDGFGAEKLEQLLHKYNRNEIE